MDRVPDEAMPPDPFVDPDKPLVREDVPVEVLQARKRIFDALGQLLEALEDTTKIDPHCLLHKDHWGWSVRALGATLEVHTHIAPNVISMLVELPMDNIIAQIEREKQEESPDAEVSRPDSQGQ